VDMPTLTAEETPGLRRELIEYLRTEQAAQMAALMIQAGRQPIRPPGPYDQVGRLLVRTEADRLAKADLWHIDSDLSELVDAAYPLMPQFAARPYDLPSRHGFATFAQPLTNLIREAVPEDRAAAEDLAQTAGAPSAIRRLLPHVDEQVPIIAVSWGPAEESAVGVVGRVAARPPKPWRHPGVWMSFYSMPIMRRQPDLMDALNPEQRAAYATWTARITVDNECLLAWCPDGAPEQRYLIGPGAGHIGTAAWAAALFATFALARQGNVAEQDDLAVPRHERRRHERAGIPATGPVRVLRLRRGVGAAARKAAGDGPGREYHHRWIVRGHWRNQWYPSIKAHRPKWIAAYLAGPDDAPLLGGDKVTTVSAPPQ
jgi:hypothetical protein